MTAAICGGGDLFATKNGLFLEQPWYDPHLLLSRKSHERQDSWRKRTRAYANGRKIWRSTRAMMKQKHWGIT